MKLEAQHADGERDHSFLNRLFSETSILLLIVGNTQ